MQEHTNLKSWSPEEEPRVPTWVQYTKTSSCKQNKNNRMRDWQDKSWRYIGGFGLTAYNNLTNTQVFNGWQQNKQPSLNLTSWKVFHVQKDKSE